MNDTEKVNAIGPKDPALNRRAFFKGAGYAGLGLAGAALVAGKLGVLDQAPGAEALGVRLTSVDAAAITDADILNFALNLEYLEAEFYSIAVTGKRLSAFGIGETGTGDYGPTTGGKQVDFSGYHLGSAVLYNIVYEIMMDEQTHVKDLRAALGSAAVAKPAINLDALGIGYASFQQFLVLSRAFEDTGVSAYGGAAPLISNKEYLSAAVRIGLVEAYHASSVRLQLAETSTPTSMLDSQDILPPPSGSQYFTDDRNSMAIVRTPSQVLSIVYHNSAPGTMKGGFFPSGVNGNINTV